MTKNQPINPSEIKTLSSIPSDKLYDIHNDLRKYYNKWDQGKVIELADTSSIENFYITTQYLTRTAPVIGAGLVAKGYTEAGIVTAGVSLYADYLITRGKEKLFKSEEKKKKLSELSKDIGNIYDRHQELLEILKPIRSSDSLPELNELLKSLREELREIIKKEKVNGEENKNGWEKRLSYIFWSLRKNKSSKIKELILLNNGIKGLGDSWNNLSLSEKVKSELSRLFISLRDNNDLWTEWKQEWEKRRNKHEKVKHLTETLQIAISEYKQGVVVEEIETNIKRNRLKLAVVRLYQEFTLLKGELDIPKELIVDFVNFQAKFVNKKPDMEEISIINIPNGEKESKELVKEIEQFIEDLEVMPIDLDDEAEKALTNLKNSLQREVDKYQKGKKTETYETIDVKENFEEKETEENQPELVAQIEQHPKKD